MENILNINSLTKVYKNKRGIFDISFLIEKNSVTGLLGPNGSGKTTIMKSIVGLLNKDNGIIKICGEDIEKNYEKAIENVGCLIETPVSIPYMTAYNNLKYVSKFYENIDEKRINEVLEVVDLIKYKDEKVKKFSLGMKQRLSIAIAILNNPSLVILDEPSNGLDIHGTAELRKLISKLVKECSVSFLISSHLIHEIEQICDKIVIINEGKLIEECLVKQVKDNGFLLEEYFINKVKNSL